MEASLNQLAVVEFGDARLKQTGALLHQRMVDHQSLCLRRLGQGRAGEVRFRRFMNNDRVTVAELVGGGVQLHGRAPCGPVDAQEGASLGLGHVHLWRRLQAKAPDYRSRPIEDKESRRWVEAAQAARQRLGQVSCPTVVADRKADIYEMWTRLPDDRTHLLIRACRDRALEIDAPQHGTKATLFA